MRKMNQLKRVVWVLMLLFMLSFVVLSGDVKPVAQVAPESKELIYNGSFEEAEGHQNARDLVRKKFDIETSEDGWTVGWWVHQNMGSGKVRIVTGNNAPDGKRYLKINSEDAVCIASRDFNDARKTYTYSFKAKGSGNMKICVFLYGIKAGKKGDRHYMGYPAISRISLTDEWKTFSGTLKLKNPDARYFVLLLACKGNVSVDQFSLKLTQETKLTDK